MKLTQLKEKYSSCDFISRRLVHSICIMYMFFTMRTNNQKVNRLRRSNWNGKNGNDDDEGEDAGEVK